MENVIFKLGTEFGETLCREIRTDKGLSFEIWNKVTGKWTPSEYACGVIVGFEKGMTITAEQDEEYMRKNFKPKEGKE